MIIERVDNKLNFGTLTLGSAGTSAVGEYLDLNSTKADDLAVVFTVDTAAAGGTSVTPLLQGSSDGSTFTTVVTGAAVALADLTAGASMSVNVPRDLSYRYIRPAVTTAGTFTAGKVSAVLDCYR